MTLNERNYDFRKKLLQAHLENLRDLNRKPAEEELEIKNNFVMIIPENAGQVLLTAAKDFQDYLFTSMDVSVLLQRGDVQKSETKNHIILCLKQECEVPLEEADGYMGYRIDIQEGIRICGFDERGVAQGVYFLEDLMNIKRAPYLKKETIKRKALFHPRMVHSGYGLDDYPNDYLSKIAHQGMDSILVYVKDVNVSNNGYHDFNTLIYNAGKYGLDVYAYSSINCFKHPDDADAKEYFDNLYGKLFRNCPNFKGLILVGESVEFPSKDPHTTGKPIDTPTEDNLPGGKPSPGFWPCFDYKNWIELLKETVHSANPDIEIVFWTYNWGYAPKEERIRLINSIPQDITLLVTYEMFETYEVDGIIETTTDYTLSFEGPGKYFISEAEAALARGIKLYTMCNTGGLTWDIGVIPYLPMPYQWMKRYKGLHIARERWNLSGLMESHHFGFYPSFISGLAKYSFFTEIMPVEEYLKLLISKYCTPDSADKVLEALRLWSEAMTHYPSTNEDQYGPFRIGPAYPLCLEKAFKPKENPYAYFGSGIYSPMYCGNVNFEHKQNSVFSLRISSEIRRLSEMERLMNEGIKILDALKMDLQSEDFAQIVNLGKFIRNCVKTTIHVKKFHLLKIKMLSASNKKTMNSYAKQIEKIALEEVENARDTIPLVKADSRLGWEPCMEYLGDEGHIQWKIKQVHYMLENELKKYKD